MPICTDPHGINCASPATRRLPGHKSGWQACGDCANRLEQEKEATMLNNKQQVHLYVFNHPGATTKDCARATGINPSSASSSAAALRNEGLMQPPDGSGQMFLTNAGLEAALKLDPPAETPASPQTSPPVVDHQNERPTYADVATEEDCDVVQTSALDVANAEIARLAAEVARLTHERRLRALERQSAPAVRLEWGKWDGEKINRVQLWVFTGDIAHNIAQIAIDHEISAALWLSDMDGERTIKVSALEVTNENLTKIACDLSILLAAAGLTMPPVPALPEKAA